MKRCCRCGAIPPWPVQSDPCERPSKLTVPIIVHSIGTVPGPAFSLGAPASGGRTYSVRARQCSGESIENSRKYTPNASALRDHASMP